MKISFQQTFRVVSRSQEVSNPRHQQQHHYLLSRFIVSGYFSSIVNKLLFTSSFSFHNSSFLTLKSFHLAQHTEFIIKKKKEKSKTTKPGSFCLSFHPNLIFHACCFRCKFKLFEIVANSSKILFSVNHAALIRASICLEKVPPKCANARSPMSHSQNNTCEAENLKSVEVKTAYDKFILFLRSRLRLFS